MTRSWIHTKALSDTYTTDARRSQKVSHSVSVCTGIRVCDHRAVAIYWCVIRPHETTDTGRILVPLIPWKAEKTNGFADRARKQPRVVNVTAGCVDFPGSYWLAWHRIRASIVLSVTCLPVHTNNNSKIRTFDGHVVVVWSYFYFYIYIFITKNIFFFFCRFIIYLSNTYRPGYGLVLLLCLSSIS